MGWKTLREHFNITHIVQVADGRVLIGSGYVSNLVSIDSKTGSLTEHQTFSGFLKQHYPALLNAHPGTITQLLETEDTFSNSIPVFTYEGGEIIEKFCEEPGWPNVTHDGCLMYENLYSTDRDETIDRARRNAEAGIKLFTKAIRDTEAKLAEQRTGLAECRADLDALTSKSGAQPNKSPRAG